MVVTHGSLRKKTAVAATTTTTYGGQESRYFPFGTRWFAKELENICGKHGINTRNTRALSTHTASMA